MPFDQDAVTPHVSGWFVEAVRYDGPGRAAIGSQTFQGPTEVHVDLNGRIVALMRLPRLPELPSRKCQQLLVEDSSGIFQTVGESWVSQSVQVSTVAGSEATLRIRPARGRFIATVDRSPTYWAWPLINAVLPDGPPILSLDRHPLRIFPTPAVPEGLPPNEKDLAWWISNQRKNVVEFTFDGNPAFIERLPDHDTRIQALVAGAERYALTAIMVGEFGTHNLGPDDIRSWFPFDLAWVLGFATGVEVGAPWIEGRDGSGNLTQRLHVQTTVGPFRSGRTVLPNTQLMGRLLTNAQSAPGFGTAPLRAAMVHATRGGIGNQGIDEALLTHVIEGLDGLCETLGIRQQNLMDGIGTAEQSAIRNTLDLASDDIRRIAAGLPTGPQAQVERIAERVKSNAANVDRDFGLAVTEALQRAGFRDVDAMAAAYASSPRLHGRAWPAVLSWVRGMILHGGYARIGTGPDELDEQEFLGLTFHLHDVLIRLLLRRLGYAGRYRPSIPAEALEYLNWVTSGTPAALLGYSQELFG